MKISQSDKDYAVDAGLETEIKPTTRLVARTAGRSPAPGLQLEPLEIVIARRCNLRSVSG